LQVGQRVTDLIARAIEMRAAQRMEEALEVITEAAAQNPDNPHAAMGRAQISFECWRPAAELFALARRFIPDNPDLIRNHALALSAEGESDAAELLLEQMLQIHPGWIDGHRTLAILRITDGDVDNADASYVAAHGAIGPNVAVTMAWFQHHVTLKQWTDARQILSAALRAFPGNRQLAMAELFLDSEEAGAKNLEQRFAAFAQMHDPGLDLCHIRYLLRLGEYEAAEAIAAHHIGLPSARIFWPYLSLCWRLMVDARAAWLDGHPLYSTEIDLDFSSADLSALADVLRGLHRLKAPYPEQSVRGGTQTDRQLFFHPDSFIQTVRDKVVTAVRNYRASLPPLDADHPLTGPPDVPILFEGSWSVRLKGSGFHAPHTHSHGWISSAFYVAVPSSDQAGDDPAGQLSLGPAPPELALTLLPYCTIAPKAGKLLLFPSTMWHGTEAIKSGERLTIAFDVRPPR
jgi:tetratricopeptide (TPR) repeat protein